MSRTLDFQVHLHVNPSPGVLRALQSRETRSLRDGGIARRVRDAPVWALARSLVAGAGPPSSTTARAYAPAAPAAPAAWRPEPWPWRPHPGQVEPVISYA